MRSLKARPPVFLGVELPASEAGGKAMKSASDMATRVWYGMYQTSACARLKWTGNLQVGCLASVGKTSGGKAGEIPRHALRFRW